MYFKPQDAANEDELDVDEMIKRSRASQIKLQDR